MSARDMATVNCQTFRSPSAVNNVITDQEPYLTGLLMVPPFPVTSEPFLVHSYQSARDQFETVIFAPTATNTLPDIDEGDSLYDTDSSVLYIVRGVQEWIRPDYSFLSLLVDLVRETA